MITNINTKKQNDEVNVKQKANKCKWKACDTANDKIQKTQKQ